MTGKQVDETELLECCQRTWGETLSDRALQVNLDELAKRGKIIRPRAGVVQPT